MMKITKGSVQETLIIPLYSRKLCAKYFPTIFMDKKSLELIEQIEYDFSAFEKRSISLIQKFGALEVAMRQLDMAIEIKEYLKENPQAAVVNMGCGLDQTAESCDNGQCLIYNIDHEDVIEIRNKLLPPKDRVRNISADLNDNSWYEKIDAANGVIFFASGVFYYFSKEQITSLFKKMNCYFPKGRLVFDIAGKKAVCLMIKTWVKMSGIKNVDAHFYVNDIEKDIVPWLNNAAVSSRGYMLGYNSLDDPSVGKVFRFLAKVCDKIMKMQIVRIDFGK